MKSNWTRRLAIAASLAVLAGCAPWSRPEPVKPVIILRRADARMRGEVAFNKRIPWTGPHLYDYMNGAAETYYARGFRELGTVEARWRGTDAMVELYQVKTPENATALFGEFNDGKGRKLPAGVASAAWSAKELEGIFHRGCYFCRLIIYGNDVEARQLLDKLATAIDASIPR